MCDADRVADLIWIERLADDGWALRIRPSDGFPVGRLERLSHFVSLHDDASLEEIDRVVGSWGWVRSGIGYRDDVGKLQIPVAPSAV